jgi:hypothetical protein
MESYERSRQRNLSHNATEALRQLGSETNWKETLEMKKQKRLSIKVLDLARLKDVTDARHRARALQAHAQRGEGGADLGPFGLRRVD